MVDSSGNGLFKIVCRLVGLLSMYVVIYCNINLFADAQKPNVEYIDLACGKNNT